MSLLPHVLCQLTASGQYWLAPMKAHADTLHAIGTAAVAAGPPAVPDPSPASPGPGSGAITTLLAWLKWLALAACAASAVAAGGMIAVGSISRRSDLAARGKAGLGWSVLGAIVVAIGIPLVNRAFRLG
jgi:hypothetical protein